MPAGELASSLREIDELRDRVESSWTVIDAPDLVADLWAVRTAPSIATWR
ncbi:hypothetical protein HQ325_21810 [Rhodococcus sp. BP-349]|nr:MULTISPECIES: hypothetical protein [unclassified Rhodococcus (in: high G+C Gram-positive bacteria)]MBY6541311.1 hypothetical protein [Rhodococcus sp. BP-363]MBY6544663.1 hypothetical protein [Rhodococcus sp. BP-369]MBY6563893.1 hypothetical protein [Rhodococcus sp. BP-370]MBY6579170.1 hypothetical protein [Rhodococcus sp. BP-364]MBY6588471.1 hypothetical protein [Rhodococcus sp. BP-358]